MFRLRSTLRFEYNRPSLRQPPSYNGSIFPSYFPNPYTMDTRLGLNRFKCSNQKMKNEDLDNVKIKKDPINLESTSSINIPMIKLLGGSEIPQIGLGTWKMKGQVLRDSIKTALEVGYRHFDCAAICGNEPALGEALTSALQATSLNRSQIWITSKLWNASHRPDLVHQACIQSLTDLNIDYVDLYLMHWPVDQIPMDSPKLAGDPSVDGTPIWETYEAMMDLQREGLSRAIGVSNFNQQEIESLIADTGNIPEVNQIEIHPYLYQRDLINYCQKQGIQVIGYSPLGSGEKPKQTLLPPLLSHDTIISIANEYHRTPAQIVLRWALQHQLITIPKTVDASRLRENIEIFNFELRETTMSQLDTIHAQIRFIQPSFHTFE